MAMVSSDAESNSHECSMLVTVRIRANHEFMGRDEVISACTSCKPPADCVYPCQSWGFHLEEGRQKFVLVLHRLDGHGELPGVALEDLMHPTLQLRSAQRAVGQSIRRCHRAKPTVGC